MEKETLTNWLIEPGNNFCAFPYRNLAVESNGDMRQCCMATPLKDDSGVSVNVNDGGSVNYGFSHPSRIDLLKSFDSIWNLFSTFLIKDEDKEIIDWIRNYRDFDERLDMSMHLNFKMTDIQAAIGREELIRQLKLEFIPYTPEELFDIAKHRCLGWFDFDTMHGTAGWAVWSHILDMAGMFNDTGMIEAELRRYGRYQQGMDWLQKQKTDYQRLKPDLMSAEEFFKYIKI
jgi:hypothetical protein